METTKQYRREKEVAEITHRGLSTLRKDRCLGKGIPYIKIGAAVFYDESDVHEYMSHHKIQLKKN